MKRQRETFDEVADRYDEVRPQAPRTAIEALWRLLGIQPGDIVVEVGAGSGQLTIPLALQGARVLALEPGRSLARLCAGKAAATPGCSVTMVESTFEAWVVVRARAVVACQAAHWIDPDVFLDRSHAVLEGHIDRAGVLALLWHIDRSEGTAFWQATQPIYARFLPDAGTMPPATIPAHVARYEQALAADRRFKALLVEHFPWARTFDAPTYLRLLETHSPVRLLGEADRAAFLAAHARVMESQGGVIERCYETVLLGARAHSP